MYRLSVHSGHFTGLPKNPRAQCVRVFSHPDQGRKILAKSYTVTKKDLLEKLIKQAHEKWLNEIGTQAYSEWVRKKDGV